MMSVIQLRLIRSDVVQRIGQPVRLRFGDSVFQPASDEDMADNFDEVTSDADQDEGLDDAGNIQNEATSSADQDEALDDADNVQTGVDIDTEVGDDTSFEGTIDGENVPTDEDIGTEVGDITTFSQLSETITTFAASNIFLTNVRKDSAPKYKGKTRIRFACKAAGKQRSRKHDETTEKRRRNQYSVQSAY